MYCLFPLFPHDRGNENFLVHNVVDYDSLAHLLIV